MPSTILDSQWLDELEAATALGLPLETVHRFFEAMLSDKRVPVAYYKGAGIPLLSGVTLRLLAGRPQPPTYKRTGRKR